MREVETTEISAERAAAAQAEAARLRSERDDASEAAAQRVVQDNVEMSAAARAFAELSPEMRSAVAQASSRVQTARAELSRDEARDVAQRVVSALNEALRSNDPKSLNEDWLAAPEPVIPRQTAELRQRSSATASAPDSQAVRLFG